MIVKTEQDKQRVIAMVNSWKLEKPMEITAREYKRVRTLEQNNKFHALIRDLSVLMGYTPEEMKSIVLYALGYYHEIQGKQRSIMVFDETHKMKVDELSTLIEQTLMWAAEKGFYLE